jgi:hypothetical protein
LECKNLLLTKEDGLVLSVNRLSLKCTGLESIEIYQIFGEIESDAESVVILTTGNKAFVAGVDILNMKDITCKY